MIQFEGISVTDMMDAINDKPEPVPLSCSSLSKTQNAHTGDRDRGQARVARGRQREDQPQQPHPQLAQAERRQRPLVAARCDLCFSEIQGCLFGVCSCRNRRRRRSHIAFGWLNVASEFIPRIELLHAIPALHTNAQQPSSDAAYDSHCDLLACCTKHGFPVPYPATPSSPA